MVLLSEQERLYADELMLVNDIATYSLSSVADWTTEKSCNVNLPKQLIVMIKAEWVLTTNGNGAGRITVDGYPVWSTGGLAPGADVTSPDIYVLLAAGAHTINFDCACFNTTGGMTVSVRNIYIGQLNFNDMLSSGPWDSGSVSLPQSTLITVLNKNITIPASRTLPVGTIINYSLLVYVVAKSAAGGRETHMKNVGDSNDSAKVNTTLYINDVQVNWTSRANDDADGSASNPTYGRGADGVYIYPVVANQTLNIKVKMWIDFAGNYGEVYLCAFLCPWITPMGTDYSPVDLVFAQCSVFYAYLEPLGADLTKSSKLGMKRFKSFGDSTDYYSVVSGTGILQHSYTLDVVDVPSIIWTVTCTYAIVCISYVAVDAK